MNKPCSLSERIHSKALVVVENWNAYGHMCDLYLLYVPFRAFDQFGLSLLLLSDELKSPGFNN